MLLTSQIGEIQVRKDDAYAEQNLAAIKAVLSDYSQIESRSLFFVIFANFIGSIKNIFRGIWSWFTSNDEYMLSKQQESFTNLVYMLIHFGINTSEPAFFEILSSLMDDESRQARQKLDDINFFIANNIYELYLHRTRTSKSVGLSYLQIYSLKKVYKAWARTLPTVEGVAPKSYLYSEQNIFGYKPTVNKFALGFNGIGEEIAPKKFKLIKRLFFWQASIAIFFTAIAQGLIPAVLSAATNGGLLYSMAIIGIPSIVIDYILFNSAVNNLIKDIWYGRLLKDDKGNFLWSGIPIFILSVCGGITYGIMAYTTSLTAFQGILVALFPTLATTMVLKIALGFAVISAFYVFVSLSALFFDSVIEIAKKGFIEQFKKFIWQNFIQRFYETDRYFISNLFISSMRALVLTGLLIAAIYLTILETALLFSMVVGLFHLPALALALVLIAAPANLMFTFKVYNFAMDFLLQLPWRMVNLCQYIGKALKNPIVLYETLKWGLTFIVLSIFNFISAQGSAEGLVDETQAAACKVILDPCGIDPSNSSAQFIAALTEGVDDTAANLQEILDVSSLYKSGTEKMTTFYWPLSRAVNPHPIGVLIDNLVDNMGAHSVTGGDVLPYLSKVVEGDRWSQTDVWSEASEDVQSETAVAMKDSSSLALSLGLKLS